MLEGTESYTVRDDDDDDPVLVHHPSGSDVDTWREGYPYDHRMSRPCTPDQHSEFIRQAPLFEQMLVNDGISLTKLWFSVTQSEQRTRFTIRQVDPVRQWKLSPTDLASLDKWEAYTAAKEDMFELTDTDTAPWTVVKSNDKKRARINAMRYVLGKFDYDNKDHEVVGRADPLIVGRALAD
jgi:hypothetical protein